MKFALLIGIAGLLGTLARWLLGRGLQIYLGDLAWSTLIVNIIGAFVAGFLLMICREKFAPYADYFPVIFIGFFGAFTTFSAFAVECADYLMTAQYAKFCWLLGLQNIGGIAAAIGGVYTAKVL